jgi:hypothetical protein
MADASSRTDTSTVLDDNDKNQRMENGQLVAAAPSNSSDRSDRSDKPLDQKVIFSSFFLEFFCNHALIVNCSCYFSYHRPCDG